MARPLPAYPRFNFRLKPPYYSAASLAPAATETWEAACHKTLHEAIALEQLAHVSAAKAAERDRVGQLLRSVVEEEGAGRVVAEADRQLVATFYAAGIIDVVWSWVAEGMARPPHEVVDRLSLVIQGDIPAALNRLATC